MKIKTKLAGHGGSCLSIIPALRKLRKENYEFKSSLSYIGSSRPAWDT
jgi:hypothetical protein